jgi:hypothetical protein
VHRISGWRTALHEEIERHRRVPFSFEDGADCAIFPADCVKAMTGVDLAAGFRGRYRTLKGALRALRSAGHSHLVEAVAAKLEPISVLKARAGDVAAFQSDDVFGWSLGVVIGPTVVVRRPEGLGWMHLDAVTKAFRVP